MKNNKILIFSILLGLFSLVLVACGSGDSDSSDGEKTVKVLLTDNPYTQELKNLSDDFEKETGLKADIEVVGQEVSEKRTQITFTGKTDDLDVVYMPAIFMEKWVKADWIAPLDEFIEESNDLDIDDFIQTTLDSMKVQDSIYGLPSMAEPVILAYRKDIFADNGITSVPETWTELEEVASKIQSNETAAIAMRGKRGQGMNMFIYPMFMWTSGGKYFEDYPENMDLAVNSPENAEALDLYKKFLIDYGPSGSSNFAVSDLLATMTQGKAAIAIDGTSVVGQLLDEDFNQHADDIGFALVPGGESIAPVPGSAVHGLAVSNFSNNKDGAYKFIEWATSSEVQKKLALNSAYPDFTRVSVSNDEEVLGKYNKEMMEVREASLELSRPDYRPLIPEWNEIGDILGARVNEAVNGGVSAEQALEQAESEVREIMDRAGY